MRLAVLVSGSATILEAMGGADLPIALVIADRECRGRQVAGSLGVPFVLHARTDFGSTFDRDGYTAELEAVLTDASIDLVAMAGFGTILGPGIYHRYRDRILNTHPALLPAFKGWHAVRDALAAQVTVTGCTVHVATAAVDDGPILAQEEVPVLPGDTEDTLSERIKTVERRLYPATLREILERGTVLTGGPR